MHILPESKWIWKKGLNVQFGVVFISFTSLRIPFGLNCSLSTKGLPSFALLKQFLKSFCSSSQRMKKKKTNTKQHITLINRSSIEKSQIIQWIRFRFGLDWIKRRAKKNQQENRNEMQHDRATTTKIINIHYDGSAPASYVWRHLRAQSYATINVSFVSFCFVAFSPLPFTVRCWFYLFYCPFLWAFNWESVDVCTLEGHHKKATKWRGNASVSTNCRLSKWREKTTEQNLIDKALSILVRHSFYLRYIFTRLDRSVMLFSMHTHTYYKKVGIFLSVELSSAVLTSARLVDEHDDNSNYDFVEGKKSANENMAALKISRKSTRKMLKIMGATLALSHLAKLRSCCKCLLCFPYFIKTWQHSAHFSIQNQLQIQPMLVFHSWTMRRE